MVTQLIINHQSLRSNLIVTVITPTKVKSKTSIVVTDSPFVASLKLDIKTSLKTITETVPPKLVKVPPLVTSDSLDVLKPLTSSFTTIRQRWRVNKTIITINNRPKWLTFSLSLKRTMLLPIRVFTLSSRQISDSTD